MKKIKKRTKIFYLLGMKEKGGRLQPHVGIIGQPTEKKGVLEK